MCAVWGCIAVLKDHIYIKLSVKATGAKGQLHNEVAGMAVCKRLNGTVR